ncbi:MAG: SpoIIE family protein phosphatase [Planctomycetaceae bacterium]|jgi:serine phosphatase RsbU (regulator of sigma subunit)|nr:SpoIIE family protein phosphatase [Planctomycetaceae bacterium]
MGYLRRVDSDPSKGERIDVVADSSRLGRQTDCEIVLNNGAVSREHARIIRDKDRFYIEDLNSRNGTYVNSTQVTARTLLHNSDRIRICDMEFIFFDEGSQMQTLHPDQAEVLKAASDAIMSDEDVCDDAFKIKSSISMKGGLGLSSAVLPQRASAEVKLRALIDIARNLGSDVEQVLPQLLDNLLRIFPSADTAYILLNDTQSKQLQLRAFRYRDPNSREPLRISRTILEKVIHTKNAILSDDVANDSRFDPSESIINFSISSIMAAPIMDYSQEEVLGVIQLDTRTAGKAFSLEDLDLLVSVSYQIAVTYQNALMQGVVVLEKIIERDMELANRVQRALLPTEPPIVPRYGFFDFYQPARYLGGDYYDYIPLPDGRVVLTLGDVSGKGIAASLFMSKLGVEVRAGLLFERDLCKTIKRLNNIYTDDRWENRFITFFFGVLEPDTNTVRFFNAGHVPPILCDGHGGVKTVGEDLISLPLGVDPDSEFEETMLTIEDGQTLVVISDGLTDAMNANGEYLGMNGVLDYLRHVSIIPVPDFGSNLINAVHSFAGRTPQTDDQSMLILGRRD